MSIINKFKEYFATHDPENFKAWVLKNQQLLTYSGVGLLVLGGLWKTYLLIYMGVGLLLLPVLFDLGVKRVKDKKQNKGQGGGVGKTS